MIQFLTALMRSVFLFVLFIIWNGNTLANQLSHAIANEDPHRLKNPITDHLSETEIVKVAIQRNPMILRDYEMWQSEINDIAVRKGYPNPVLGLGYFINEVETAVGPQQFKFGITQAVPWFGKLKTEESMQTLQARIAEQTLFNTINQVRHDVLSTYYDYYYLIKTIHISEENLRLLNSWLEITENKYRTSQVNHPDLIKAQIEIIHLENNLKTLRHNQAPLVARLTTLLNDTSFTYIQVPDSLITPSLEWTKDSLLQELKRNNPVLLSHTLGIEYSQSKLKRAKLSYYPDLSVGMDYIFTNKKFNNGVEVPESGKNPFLIKLGVSLPIWLKNNRNHVESAVKQVNAYTHNRVNTQNQLVAEFEQAYFEFRDSERSLDLYEKGLIPKSIESLRATEKAYISNKTDFLNLIDAQKRYLDYLLDREQAVITNRKALLKLEKLIGREL